MMTKKITKALGITTAMVTLTALLCAPVIAKAGAENVANAAAKKVEALEAQVKQMADMLRSMQAELARVQDSVGSPAKVQELEQWMATVKKSPMHAAPKEHMVFFRGGYARNDSSREGSILTDANARNEGTGGNVAPFVMQGITTSSLTGNSPNGDEEAWHFGAGFEFNVSNDLFGLLDDTGLLGEVTVGYKEFDRQTLNRAPLGTAANDSATGAAGSGGVTDAVCGSLGGSATGLSRNGGGPYGSCSANVAVSQITLTAAPKIKFMHGSKLRPWIIPAGFAIHVISPPSDGVTYISPGILFGAGVDYSLWKNIHVGIDGRYHLVSNTTADVELDGFEVGGYVGFGF